MVKDNRFTIIKTRDLANAIRYISGIPYYVYNDKINPEKEVFSFPNTEKFREVYEIVNNAMYKYRNK